jgi:DNA-binding SARP family transcriptional activator
VQPEAHQSKAVFSQQCTAQGESLPSLHILCFGHFQVLRSSEPLTLCQNRYGQAIFRYLVAQTNHRATADILMEAFWPDNEMKVARRKLQVAVSALRCSLNQGYDCCLGGGYILYKDQYYQINPDVTIASDRDEFLTLYEQGRHSNDEEAIAYYERACQLYTGPCFVEDTYANWSSSQREQCMLAHSTMCNMLSEYALARGNYDDAIYQANLVLTENRCDETAYRLLMQAYTMQGCRSEAIRQYQRCEQVLHEELGVAPMPETIQAFQDILNVTHELK